MILYTHCYSAIQHRLGLLNIFLIFQADFWNIEIGIFGYQDVGHVKTGFCEALLVPLSSLLFVLWQMKTSEFRKSNAGDCKLSFGI